MNIQPLGPDTVERTVAFFHDLPERDRTFIKEDVADADAMRRMADSPGQRWVAVDGETITGFAAVLPLTGWSDHVGELRLVVNPQARGTGVGRALARHALAQALRAGVKKVVVELAAEQESAIAMFSSLGFTGEALLRDHFRDRNGELRDLVMLAHFVDDTWASMDTIGLTDELSV